MRCVSANTAPCFGGSHANLQQLVLPSSPSILDAPVRTNSNNTIYVAFFTNKTGISELWSNSLDADHTHTASPSKICAVSLIPTSHPTHFDWASELILTWHKYHIMVKERKAHICVAFDLLKECSKLVLELTVCASDSK